MFQANRTNMRDAFSPDERKDYRIQKIGYSFFKYSAKDDDGIVGYRFHKTTVVLINHSTNRFKFNTGGWPESPTTRNKINSVIPFGYLTQAKGVQYFGGRLLEEVENEWLPMNKAEYELCRAYQPVS